MNWLVYCIAGVLLLSGCASRKPEPPEQSIQPGVNREYLDPELQVAPWVERFEKEGREVYDQREQILAAAKLRRGMAVADVGAGTGLFTPLIAEAIGPRGVVYAVDIAPKFLEHIERRARADGLVNVKPVLGTERSVRLPPNSVDLAFICDTYHHFEYPKATLASIHEALRPGGEILLVEFKRIPGVSSDWTINHVRAGQEDFTREIESAGFRKIDEVDLLKDNYILRFRKISRTRLPSGRDPATSR